MDRINILCSTDDKFAPYYGIMLTSLFENNKEEEFVIYVMTAGLGNQILRDYHTLTNQYHAELHIITIDNAALKECPIRTGDHVTIATYYRLLSPKLLDNIDKILYLDGDIIINGKIRPLWETDIREHALAAVVDVFYYQEESHLRLNIPFEYDYFNAGVLLMNLKYWRDHQVMNRCMRLIETQADKLIYHDQDTINAILYKEIKKLPLTYNFQFGFIYRDFHNKLGKEVQEEIKSNLMNPVIIHYSGSHKPWHKRSRYPYTPYYLYYKKISLWKRSPQIGNFTLCENIKYYLNKIIWTLGIKKEFNSYIVNYQTLKNNKN